MAKDSGTAPANSKPIRVDVKPGYMFRYSGGGYCVVQQLLVDTTGLSFPEVMKQEVLGPLGMTQTSFLPRPHAQPGWGEKCEDADGAGHCEGAGKVE